MAEQCNRHWRKGEQCVSPSVRLRTGSASLRAAGPVLSKAEGVGEPRKAPEELAPAKAGGHATANMVLSPFAQPKVARPPGRNPALLPPSDKTYMNNNSVLYSIGWVACGQAKKNDSLISKINHEG